MLGTSTARPWPDRILLVAILTGTLLLSVPALWNVSIRWHFYEQFGHAYLMALVAAWFVYAKRTELAGALRELDPPRFGALLVLAAASFEVLAFVGDLGFLSGIGVPLLLGAVAYAVDYELDLFSNFTYFLDHPDTGDQFEQRDDRNVYGV